MVFLKKFVKKLKKLFKRRKLRQTRRKRKTKTSRLKKKSSSYPKKKKTVSRRKKKTQQRTSKKSSKLKPSGKKKRLSPKRKKTKRQTGKPVGRKKKMAEQKPSFGLLVGPVTHYFSKIGVCVVHIKGRPLHQGDWLRIKGHTTDFIQKVESLQVESRDVKIAKKGQLVGLKVSRKTRAGDMAYLRL